MVGVWLGADGQSHWGCGNQKQTVRDRRRRCGFGGILMSLRYWLRSRE